MIRPSYPARMLRSGASAQKCGWRPHRARPTLRCMAKETPRASEQAPPRSTELWLLTADSRSARLFSAAPTAQGRLHVTQRDELAETWEEREHHRPAARIGPHGHNFAPQSHEEEERIHRFARELARWLERALRERPIGRVHAFCAKRLLGPLRKELPMKLHERVVEHHVDLAQLSPGELATHAAVALAEREERAHAERGSAAG